MAWFKKSIRSRVLDAIEPKIVEAQAKYDEGCKVEDEKLVKGVEALTNAHKATTEALADSIVKSIVK